MVKDGPAIGEVLSDGRICAGSSPRTGKIMYVTERTDGVRGDALTWEEARAAMANLAPFGLRLPTKAEIIGRPVRSADEKDTDPFRQQRLPAVFIRAGARIDSTSETVQTPVGGPGIIPARKPEGPG